MQQCWTGLKEDSEGEEEKDGINPERRRRGRGREDGEDEMRESIKDN